MLAGYVVQGYRTVVPVFDTLAGATWFSWTAEHIPLAGRTDWPPLLGIVALACSSCWPWAWWRSRGGMSE